MNSKNLSMTPAAIEGRARRRAASMGWGYRIEKSRARNLHSNNHGGYQIIDAHSNTVVDGLDYDIKLEKLGERLDMIEQHDGRCH